ncbi:hypothetical protein GGI23_005452 [Coemansia sp. RSA 2559]|nr:hypothetical protein GGI23_005452 [Coemansia sp. RSA 2559]
MVLPLNRIRNATMFVPTNDAIKKYRKEHEHGPAATADNVYGGVTDRQAWYHLIADGIIDRQTLAARTMLWESYSYPVEGRPAFGTDGLSHGIMLKTKVDSNTTQLAVNGVPVLEGTFSCEAGSAFLIDGVLEIPPTILDILHEMTPSQAHNQRRQIVRGDDEDDASSTGEYSFVEKLLSAAGWHAVLDTPKGATNESAAMHTLWAFDNRAFSTSFNFAERSYLLHGPIFAADDQDLLDESIKDTQAVAARYLSTGPISVARLGEGKHEGLYLTLI